MPLMNNYSEIFSIIDEKIIELLGCAYNDFMSLNQNFKEIAKNARQFIENTNEIQNSLHNICNDDNIEQLTQLENSLLDSSHSNLQIIEINETIKHIINNTNDLKILFKNLNQDLLTIRFLIANFQLSDSYIGSIEYETFELWINRINLYRQTENINFQKLNSIIEQLQKLITQINYLNQPLFEVHNIIQIGNGIISDKKLLFNQQQQAINIDVENIGNSIADIITNLQYHDIIKQKIEHVCLSQKKIKNDSLRISGNDAAEEQYLSEIKELVSIQSAILVKANQEYQQAIENIMVKLKSICESTGHVAAVTNRGLDTKVGDIMMDPMSVFNKLYESCTKIQDIFKSEDDTFSNMLEINAFIDETIKSIFDQTQNNNFAEAQQILSTTQGSVSQQITQVLDDLRATTSKVEDICKDTRQSTDQLSKIYDTYRQSHATGSLRNQIATLYISLINSLENDINKIKELHTTNAQINQHIISNVSSTVDGIHYYEMFEQKIIVITNKLNKIFSEVHSQTSPEKLESLRKMYTMQSEHNIHTNIVKGPSDSSDNTDSEEAVGDVELF